MNGKTGVATLFAVSLLLAASAATATPFFFSTGSPDGQMGTASRPASGGLFGIESADDFVLSQHTTISSARFTGLLTGRATTADIGSVGVEIYRVFPSDSNVARTSGAPTFSTSMVPTRVNSPADVAFDSRAGGFSVSTISTSFTVANSVRPGGIHPLPNPTTGGDGAVAGTEVEFTINFLTPLDLVADHYFFVPLVEVTGGTGDFLWLSAPRPIVPPGTPFSPGNTDLQTWTRDDFLDPDWLRVGTDIVGGTTFNAVFSLTGATVASGSVPEPGSLFLVVAGSLALLVVRRLKPVARLRAKPIRVRRD